MYLHVADFVIIIIIIIIIIFYETGASKFVVFCMCGCWLHVLNYGSTLFPLL
jgi:hypothetical protein